MHVITYARVKRAQRGAARVPIGKTGSAKRSSANGEQAALTALPTFFRHVQSACDLSIHMIFVQAEQLEISASENYTQRPKRHLISDRLAVAFSVPQIIDRN